MNSTLYGPTYYLDHNKQTGRLLTGQRSFDWSRLIKRGETELELRRPTEDVRNSDTDNRILKQYDC